MLNEFEQISKEIHAWAQYDQEYTQMLIVYAHQKGYITAEQAEASIADLKKWWEDNEPENEHIKENRKQAMMAMLEQTKDMSLCRVFWTLFKQAPDYAIGDGWFKAPHEKNAKSLDLPNEAYYDKINKLFNMGYLD